MKTLFIFNKNQKNNNKFNYFDYTYYRYHRLFFRSLIFRGRKLWAFNFFLNLKLQLKVKEKVEPYWVFIISILKITPDLMLFPLKLGGVVKGVPLPITERKRYTFAVKWVIKLLRDKHRKITLTNVSDALIGAIYDRGSSIEKKMSVYQISTENRHLIRFFR